MSEQPPIFAEQADNIIAGLEAEVEMKKKLEADKNKTTDEQTEKKIETSGLGKCEYDKQSCYH